MRKTVSSLLLASSLGAAWALPPQLQLDSLHASLDTLSNNMESTLLGKDDLPLAVSGYMAFRLKNFHYSEQSPWVRDDKARTSVDAILNVNVVAMPNSYITLFTNLMFPFDLSGIYTNYLAKNPTKSPTNADNERVLFDHSTDYYGSTINEELNVGVDIRAGVFGAYVTAGGVIWANASPLTMWERETNPRFVWQYELFEDEKTVSTYYKEKAFKPVKEGGRAFWTNRSFGGVFANVYQLPYDMKAQFLVAQPIDADVATRDGLRMYGGQPGELEMSGGYDFRGTVLHGRIAKEKIADNLTVGVNYMGVTYDKGSIFEPEFRTQWTTYSDVGFPTLLNTHVATVDVKGNVTPKLYLMADVGVSITDSTVFIPDPQAYDYAFDTLSGVNRTKGYTTNKEGYRSSMATPKLGLYVKAQSKYIEGWPMTAELVFFQPGFYSPYSLTNPSRFTGWRKDETYLNAGALRYSPNMAGINFKLEPSFNRGYFDFQYAQHRQIDPGQDVIAFNYRLNGRNIWEGTNSWTKHKPLFVADSGNSSNAGYINRVGANKNSSDGVKMYRQRGGLYGGTWEMWESFAAYDNGDQAAHTNVPMHAKWSSYLSFMGGYDIGHWFGTDRNIMMTGYFALSGISTSFNPLAVSEKQSNVLLTSFYGQFEPTVAVTPTFHMVGILGFETFRSDKAYVLEAATNTLGRPQAGKTTYVYEVNSYLVKKAPINYKDFAIGLGFDWDFSDRVGLHFRYKFMTHSDETVPDNDWHSHYIAAETKAWF